jgi:hypothetical protein
MLRRSIALRTKSGCGIGAGVGSGSDATCLSMTGRAAKIALEKYIFGEENR